MSKQTCGCGRPVDGTTLCSACKHTLAVALANIAACHRDLEVVRTGSRAVRYDLPHGKGPGRAQPLVVDERFLPEGRGSTALHAARNAVTTWARVILEEHPSWPGPARDTVASVCAWLQTNLGVIAAAAWAEACKRDMLDAERALMKVDARGPELLYAGLCTVCLVVGDRTPMYAHVGDEWVKCPAEDCGMEYRVEARRNLMRDALEYEWMTAAAIADLATYLQLLGDREWVRKKLNRWHNEGTLRPASVDVQGNPLFPFGDAVRLLTAADATRRLRLKGA